MPRVQRAALFYKSKRVATLQNVTYRINSNDTQELADGGAYNTDGIVVTEVSCDTICPVSGVGVSIVRDLVEHRDVDLALGIVDGKIHEIQECRAKSAEFTGEVTNGKLTGKFEWHGPAPKITGG